MRKTFLILLLGLWPALAHPQSITTVAGAIKGGATLPTTCRPATTGSRADVFIKTGASSGLYTCSAANTWTAVGGGGSGDVVGPASSTDNAVARFDLATGKLIQNSVVLIGDTGNVTGLGTLNTHTIPGGTDTFALLAASQALTGKTYNGLTINSTTGTLAVTNGKTLTLSNSLTLSGTDGSSVAFGTGGTVAYTNVAALSSLATVGTITSGGLGAGAVLGGVTLTLGSDAAGDTYYRSAGGVLTRLPKGTDGQVWTLASGLPSWAMPSGGTTINTSGQGIWIPDVLYDADGFEGVATGNDVKFYRFINPIAVTADRADFKGVVAQASGKFSFSLRSWDCTTTTYFDSGVLDTTSWSNVDITATLTSATLPAGGICLLWTHDNTTSKARVVGPQANTMAIWNIPANKRSGTCSNTSTAGVLPSACGTQTGSNTQGILQFTLRKN